MNVNPTVIIEINDNFINLLTVSMTTNRLAYSSLILNIINSRVFVNDTMLSLFVVVLRFLLTLSNRYNPPEWKMTARRWRGITAILNDELLFSLVDF